MTQRDAVQILIIHSRENCAGAGCGIRSLPSYEERKRVEQAIKKLWSKAYNFDYQRP